MQTNAVNNTDLVGKPPQMEYTTNNASIVATARVKTPLPTIAIPTMPIPPPGPGTWAQPPPPTQTWSMSTTWDGWRPTGTTQTATQAAATSTTVALPNNTPKKLDKRHFVFGPNGHHWTWVIDWSTYIQQEDEPRSPAP